MSLTINDYRTGETIERNARVSERLAGATADSETGSVWAIRDSDGIWQYVPETEAAARGARAIWID